MHDARLQSLTPPRPPATPAGLPHQPMIHELHQEIRDRLALARHAKRRGWRFARVWHVELALDARRQLRAYATR